MQDRIEIAAEEISLFTRLQMHMRKELPIRSSEMGTLIYVQKQSEGVTPLMISSFFQVAKPTVTTMVNELIRKGYLIKVPSETDGRSYSVSITGKGQELVTETHSEYFRGIELLRKKMGDEDFESFIKLIRKANAVLSEERR